MAENSETVVTDSEEPRNKLVVFGENIGEIPCFRSSFLYGISGGIGAGIVFFALTSKVPSATKFGFWSYVGITFTYWCQCRYNYSMTQFQYRQLQYAMKQSAMRDGTKDSLQSTLLAENLEIDK